MADARTSIVRINCLSGWLTNGKNYLLDIATSIRSAAVTTVSATDTPSGMIIS